MDGLHLWALAIMDTMKLSNYCQIILSIKHIDYNAKDIPGMTLSSFAMLQKWGFQWDFQTMLAKCENDGFSLWLQSFLGQNQLLTLMNF